MLSLLYYALPLPRPAGTAPPCSPKRETSIDHSTAHAVLLLPLTLAASDNAERAARWLSRGRVSATSPRQQPLFRIVDALGMKQPDGGLAALRLWAQTGERSAQWIAAADPVHMQTRLHHLRVSAFGAGEIPLADLREIYRDLQTLFDADRGFALARIGGGGYLRGSAPLATSDLSPVLAHGGLPDEFPATGADPAAHDRLLGEIQMSLHANAVNQRREAAGLRSINSLWIWGGGIAQPVATEPMPRLYTDDPVVQGFWLSKGKAGERWCETLENCLDGGSFVALPPTDASLSLDECLHTIGNALRSGRLDLATIGFADGITAALRRRDLYRIWRGPSPLFNEGPSDA